MVQEATWVMDFHKRIKASPHHTNPSRESSGAYNSSTWTRFAPPPLALLVAPLIGLKHFRSCILAHFERLKDFDVRDRSPSKFADRDELGLSLPSLPFILSTSN